MENNYNITEENKIYILGGKGVGKTSLFNLIFSEQFIEGLEPSEIGIIKSTYKYEEKVFTIKELTDDENFFYTNKLKNELEDILLIFVLFSFSDKASFEKAKDLIHFIKNNITNNKEIQIVLIGNKYDLYESLINEIELDEETVQKYEKEENLKYINISCKLKKNIDQIKEMINNLDIEKEKEEEDDGGLNEEERKKQAKGCVCF